MGKASRRRRETASIRDDRPRWAGAYGFQYAWAITQRYLLASQTVLEHDWGEGRDQLMASLDVATMRMDLLERQVGVLDTLIAEADGTEPGRVRQVRAETVFPGAWDEDTNPQRMMQYARSINELSTLHDDALRRSTPILFDPACHVQASDHEFVELNLPFQHTFCDFMGADGQAMPVHETSSGQVVALVGCTMVQSSEGGAIDVYPIVTTTVDEDDTIADRPKSLLYGMTRFGGPLPEAPQGIQLVEQLGAQMWMVELDEVEDHDFWATLFVLAPALAAAACLRLLDAVNVDLEPAVLPRAERRRAEREGAWIPLEVRVRPRKAASRSTAIPQTIDWQYRWTVRGHWMHFTRGPIFNANPRKRVVDPIHGECVKVWCPPCVKGPNDKPLVLKTRRADTLTTNK